MNRSLILSITLLSFHTEAHGQLMKNSLLTFGYANYGLIAFTGDNSSGRSEFLDKCRAQSYSLTLNRPTELYRNFTFQYGMGLNAQILTAGYNSSSRNLNSINDDVRMRKTNLRLQSVVQVGYNVLKIHHHDLGIGAGLLFNGTIFNSSTSERYIGSSTAPDTISVISKDNKNFVSNLFYCITVSPQKGRSGFYASLRYVLNNLQEDLNFDYRIAQSRGLGIYRFENGNFMTKGNFVELLLGYRFK